MCLGSRLANLSPGLLKQTRGLESDDGRMLRRAGLGAACTGGWARMPKFIGVTYTWCGTPLLVFHPGGWPPQ